MDYSLSWLREPDVEDALPDLITGMIRDIRLILVHPDLGNAAKLAAITEAVDQFAPPPGPQANGTQMTGLQAAASIVALLARNAGPATLLFEELAHEQIRIEMTGRADRLLTSAECHELRAAQGTSGHYRSGALRTVDSGLLVAEVTSLVLPWRLPEAAREALGIPDLGESLPPASTIPFGKALAEFGVRREPLGARLVRDSISTGGHVSVESSALMWLDDVPVALAGERVTAQFCCRAISRLTHPAGQAQPAQAPHQSRRPERALHAVGDHR
ncbi:MAG TPA: hypothetical protein VMU95_29340 [Trebonia sp.]|nr:hypothetical protein [Trebonia sp.]